VTRIPWLADDGEGHCILGGGADDVDYPGAPDERTLAEHKRWCADYFCTCRDGDVDDYPGAPAEWPVKIAAWIPMGEQLARELGYEIPDPSDTFDQDALTRDDDRRCDSQWDRDDP
jgi:hypothetical protein